MDKGIRFTIPRGKPTRIEAVGFAGEGCTDAVNSLLQKMQAVPLVEPEFTPDYHKAPPEKEFETDGG